MCSLCCLSRIAITHFPHYTLILNIDYRILSFFCLGSCAGPIAAAIVVPIIFALAAVVIVVIVIVVFPNKYYKHKYKGKLYTLLTLSWAVTN